MSGQLTGTSKLLRAAARFDGPGFAPWILIVTALSASSVLVYPLVFPTLEDRAELSAAVGGNPALSIIFGRAADLLSVDGFNTWRSLALGGFLAALGAIFSVTRATRGQEDSGQAELLASGVMGRGARLMSASVLALAGTALLGAVAGTVTGLSGGAWEASMLLGATFSATGWLFAGVAAVAAQIASDARTANSVAVGTLGVLFLLRGVLDALEAPEWTAWINPLGWISRTSPAGEDNWWPLLPAAGLTVVLLAAAFAVQARRDFGQGLLGQASGPAEGRLSGPWLLVLRLNRASMLTWAVAFLALGVVFGYLSTSVRDLLGGNEGARSVLAAGAVDTGELTRSFIQTILSLIGIIAAVAGVQVMLRLRAEEMADRVEPLLAGPLGRTRYFAANVVPALAVAGLLTVLAGTVLAGIAAGADTGVGFGQVLLQAVLTVPAVWTTAAVAVLVVGARPGAGPAAWAGVLLSFALTLLGPTFRLPDVVLDVSPFRHVPAVGEAAPDLSGLAGITVVTALLAIIGFVGFRRRDVAR